MPIPPLLFRNAVVTPPETSYPRRSTGTVGFSAVRRTAGQAGRGNGRGTVRPVPPTILYPGSDVFPDTSLYPDGS